MKFGQVSSLVNERTSSQDRMCLWGKCHDLAWCSWLFIVWLKQALVSSYRFSCGQVAFFHFSVLVSSFPPMLFLAHKLIIHWEPVQVYPFVRIPHLWWYPFRFVIFYFHNRYVLLPHSWLSGFSMCYKHLLTYYPSHILPHEQGQVLVSVSPGQSWFRREQALKDTV